jgi:hypothetical protein
MGDKGAKSPSYPFLDLVQAIEKAQVVYTHAQRKPVPVSTVIGYWKYGAKSSGGRLALAALRKFGLLESVGNMKSGEVKLTDLAARILLDSRPESPERDAAIKEAALTPGLYRELWDHWNGFVPGDDTVCTYLMLNKHFKPEAAKEFLADFKATILFAKLTPDDKMPLARGPKPEEEEDEEEGQNRDKSDNDERRTPRRRPMQPGTKEDTYTLDEGQVVIQWPERIGAEEIEDVEGWMQIVIRKMKRTAQKADQSQEE